MNKKHIVIYVPRAHWKGMSNLLGDFPIVHLGVSLLPTGICFARWRMICFGAKLHGPCTPRARSTSSILHESRIPGHGNNKGCLRRPGFVALARKMNPVASQNTVPSHTVGFQTRKSYPFASDRQSKSVMLVSHFIHPYHNKINGSSRRISRLSCGHVTVVIRH